MTEAFSANLEMAIVLPLGVAGNQLMRIEADLRLLNMEALDFAKGRKDIHLAQRIEARLENISETLESIRGLVADIEGCIQSRSTDVNETSTQKPISSVASPGPREDTRLSSDSVYSHANRKPHPDRDD